MASPTQWTWVWVRSRRQWRTGTPGVLWATGSQRGGHNLTTEQQQLSTCTLIVRILHINGTTTRETDTRTGSQWCARSFQALEFCSCLWFPSHSPWLLPGRGMDYHILWNQVSKSFQIHSSELNYWTPHWEENSNAGEHGCPGLPSLSGLWSWDKMLIFSDLRWIVKPSGLSQAYPLWAHLFL